MIAREERDAVGRELARVALTLDRALMAQDANAAAGCFTADAVLGESGLEDVVGRGAIERFLAAADRERKVVHHATLRDRLVFTEQGVVELCRFDETKQRPGSTPVHERGRAVIFWRRDDDGAWRIERIVVSDLPVRTA